MASTVQVKIKGTLYPIDQLINKSIYAAKTTPLYPYIGGKALIQVNSGGLIGVMYSWNQGTDDIYLTFYSNASSIKKYYPDGYYVVKASDVDERTITGQGAKTTKQIEEERKEAEESANESTSDKLMKTVLKLGLGIAAIFALSSIVKSKI